MKKKLYGTIILTLLLFITGCGEKTETKEEILKNVIDNMNQLKNYNMNIEVNMLTDYDGEKSYLTMILDSDIDTQNNTMKLSMKIDDEDEKIRNNSYVAIQNRNATTYFEDTENNEWIIEENDGIKTQYAVSNISNMLTNAKIIEEIETQTNKQKIYILSVTKEDGEKLFQAISSATEELEEYELGLIKDVNIEVTINTEEDYIETITVYLLEALNDELSSTIDNFIITYEFSEFNEVGNITIPNSIKENATVETVCNKYIKKADENSAHGILDAARLYYAEQLLKDEPIVEGVRISDLWVSGELPNNSHEVEIIYNEDGTINIGPMKFKCACFKIDHSKVSETECP